MQDKSSIDTPTYPVHYPAIRRDINQTLIVDDDLNIRALVSFYLKNLCRPDHADNGLDALEAAVSKNYDLFLLDIDLGYGLNGVEVARRLRKLSQYQDVPIVAMTASVEPGIRNRCLDAGMDVFIPKPFYKKQLLNEVENLLKENNR